MNKKILFPSLAMLVVATVTVVGCSKDDEFYEFDANLDINYNTHTRRSVPEDGLITGSSETIKKEYYKVNTYYNKVQAGCGITTLVDMWIKSKKREYFEVPPSMCPKNAQQYADEILASLGDSYNDTTGICASDIVNVANSVNSTESLTYRTFTSSSEKTAFFANKDNRQKVQGITLYNAKTKEGHSASTTYVGSSSVSFTGFDIFNPDKNRYGTYSIPVSGSKEVNKKDGSDGGAWELTGVYLR